MNICPPFRALVYAMFIPSYDEWVRDYQTEEKVKAGSNDLFISVYLPYCDTFVTDNGSRRSPCERSRLPPVSRTKVLSYEDFCARFLVTA